MYRVNPDTYVCVCIGTENNIPAVNTRYLWSAIFLLSLQLNSVEFLVREVVHRLGKPEANRQSFDAPQPVPHPQVQLRSAPATAQPMATQVRYIYLYIYVSI